MTLVSLMSSMRRNVSTGDHNTAAADSSNNNNNKRLQGGGGESHIAGQKQQQQQQKRHTRQHSHGNIARNATHFNTNNNDDNGNNIDIDIAPPAVIISSTTSSNTSTSSPGTPPKKVWEKSYHKFLTLHRRGTAVTTSTTGSGGGDNHRTTQLQQHQHQSSASSSPSTLAITPAETSTSSNYSHNSTSQPSSSLTTPKGLLSRKMMSTRHAVKQQQQGVVDSTTTVAAAPLHQQQHSAPPPPPPPAVIQQPMLPAADSSVRGGNFFSQVFRSGSTGSTGSTGTTTSSPKSHRRIKSISISDELDGTLRRGAQKSSYSSNPKLAAAASLPGAGATTGQRTRTSCTDSFGQHHQQQHQSQQLSHQHHQPHHAHAYHSPGGTTTRRSASLSMGNIIQAFEGSTSLSSSSNNRYNSINDALSIPVAPQPLLLQQGGAGCGAATAALQSEQGQEQHDDSVLLSQLLDGLEPPLTHLSARTTSSSSFLAGRTFLPPMNSMGAAGVGGRGQPLVNGLVAVSLSTTTTAGAAGGSRNSPACDIGGIMVLTENDDDDEEQGAVGGGHCYDELDERIKKRGGGGGYNSSSPSSFSSSPSSVAIAAAAAASSKQLTASAMKKAFTDFHNSQTTGHDGGSAFLHSGHGDSSSSNKIFGMDGDNNIDDDNANHYHNDSSFHKAEHLFWAAPPPTLTSVVSHGNLASQAATKMAAAAASSCRPSSVSTLCLESVPEHRKHSNHMHNSDGLFEQQHQHRQSRILRPFNRVDSWQPGRRYLIAPAVQAACPMAVWHSLGGGGGSNIDSNSRCIHHPQHAPPLSAQQAAAAITENDDSNHGLFQRILLGDCLVSHGVLGARGTRDNSATTTATPQPSRIAAQWSSACLVLQQNYLLEFPQGTFGKSTDNASSATVGHGAATSALAGAATTALAAAEAASTAATSMTQQQAQPRGYAHLEFSQTFAQDDFCDALELLYYASPCAKKDLRVVLIRLSQKNAKERDAWKTCLNRAASLQMEDLYSIFTRGEFEKQVIPEQQQNKPKNGIDALSNRHHHGRCDDKDEKVILGKGQYSAVYPARRKDATQSIVALKVLEKNAFWKLVVKGRERADTLVRETSVQATLSAKCMHLNSFLRLRGLFESSTHVVLELEYLQGTVDLFQYISSKGVLSESEAAQILSDILHSLAAMSHIGLAHRDVKPANVLMCNQHPKENTSDTNSTNKDSSSSLTRVKVCDFGMSTFVGVDGHVRGRCGTPGYVAPEIFSAGIHGGYGNQVDVFSAGVTLYVMLCGYEPFYGETDAELVENNRQAKVEFPPEEWSGASKEAIDLVRRMMEPDPRLRPSAKEVLKHAWFQKHSVIGNNLTQKNKSNNPQQEHENYNLDGDASACVIS